ncbi:hypothetical protein G7061_06285 [Erysipelothrix sp. HDW6B]|uniref:hypothetical protein n=1 Tax=Erysipelothrix TaxID=1647 RepID=UPI00140D7C45|nr:MULTISPECIES: hypothetical protein [Erysipelothrix]QIK86240.1 hypothetical protein G7061_06285 [Erysipelothrix sp. HDW6B]
MTIVTLTSTLITKLAGKKPATPKPDMTLFDIAESANLDKDQVESFYTALSNTL